MLRNKFLLTTILFLFFSAFALTSIAGTLYWVGNGGNWTDAKHWARISGGQGGAGIPTSTDDAIFDLNSFNNPDEQIVVTSTVTCHTLQTIPGIYNPQLVGNSNASIDVYGSLMLEGSLDYEFQGSIHFKSAQAGNAINTGGRKLNAVFFEGSGSWKMYNLLYAENITLSSGDITTGGFEVACTNLTIEGNSNKTLDISNSILFVEQQINQQNSSDLQFISQKGKIFLQHYLVSNLSAKASNTHRALSADSSHYGESNLTCNTGDSLGGTIGICNGRAWVTQIYPIAAPVGTRYSIVWNVPFGAHVSANGDTLDDVCPPNVSYQIYDTTDGSLSDYTLINISEPGQLNLSYAPRQPKCNGYCDGWIHYYLFGETPPYTYGWLNGGPSGVTPGGVSHYLYDSALCAGKYNVHVIDSKGCHKTLTTITLSPVSTVSVTTTHTNPSCSYSCNGTAIATGSGGHVGTGFTTGPFTYVWKSPTQNTQTAVNLCPGIYTVTAYDDSGCSGTNTTTIIAPPAIVVPVPTSTNVTCHGLCNGSAKVNASGGTPGSPIQYTYLWSPSGQTTQTATGLCAGSYKVVVFDGNGCKDSNTVTITQPTALVIQSITASPNPLLCNGNCNATASVTVLAGSGTPGYTYAWDDGSTNFTNTNTSVSGLCVGTYVVQITDANGCIVKDSVSITQPNPISIVITSHNPKCKGGPTGYINSVTSNGSSPYTYLWSPGGQTTANITGLLAGNYTLHVTDKNGCSDSTVVTLTDPSSVSASITSTTPTCFSNCNGSAIATGTGGNGAPYKYTWSNGHTTSTITNLCAGTYTVVTADDSGCTGSATVTIVAPSVVSVVNTGQNNVTCNGLCNGKITVSASGGTPGKITPYTYLWSPGGQTTKTITGLCAGAYKVVAKDSNGCKDSITVTITQPNILKITSLTANPNPLLCNGDCNAVATVNSVTGGTAPYIYAWSNGSAGPSDANLCIGKYVVTVADVNGCKAKDSLTITQPTALSILTAPVNPTCNGSCNGSITTATSGGKPGYTYLWKPTGQNTANIHNACAGTYTVVVTDKDGCNDSAIVTLTQPTAILPVLTITEVTCNGSCNGKVVASVSGGTSTYTYTWNGGVTQTTDSITGLCANNNDSLRVNDGNGCSYSKFFAITQPTILTTSIVSKNSSCTACNGSAKVSASGGKGPYIYSWNTVPVQKTDSAFNLCPGNYTVTVTDADSCKTPQAVTIVPTVTITITSSASGLSCSGSCDGTASANASGGTVPYIYSWSNGQTTSTATNLCAGTYTIVVHDQSGCTNTDSASFTNPPPLVGDTSKTNVSCNGSCVGAAADTVTGGTPPYTYSWSSGQTTSSVSNLCPGIYTITVLDSKLCKLINTVTIAEAAPLAPNATMVLPTCNFSNGSITTNPTGGVGKYTYSWSTGATTSSINALSAGTYTVTITDSLGCSQAFPIALSNQGGATLASTIKNVTCWTSCDGADSVYVTSGTAVSYSWSTGSTSSSISNVCAGPYICTVTDVAGCLTLEEDTVKKPKPISPHITLTSVTCNGSNDGSISLAPTGGNAGGYTYTWNPSVSTTSSATNLVPGLYTITITDPKSCDTTFTVKVTQPSLLAVSMSVKNVTCNGDCNGIGFGHATGGTLPYIYSWSNAGVDSSDVNLCPGTYTLTVTDGNGCPAIGNVTITQPAALKDSVSQINDSCFGESDGMAVVFTTGGTSPYAYSWTGGDVTSSINNLSVGKYYVTTTDQNSCTVTDSVTITQPTPVSIGMSILNSTCNSGCNGIATVTIIGGTGPYGYSWSNGTTTSSDSGLCATTYTVVITDVNKCTATKDTLIGQPAPIALLTGSKSTSCPTSCDGQAKVTASGGTAPYTYKWSNANASTTDTILNVCAGTYTVVVTDANLCTDTDYATVSSPLPIVPGEASSPSNCGAVCNGYIVLTPSGGTAPYTYKWSSGQTTDSTGHSTCAGVYTYTITDADLCVATFTTILSNNNGPTGVTLTKVNDSCFGECNGILIIPPIGGTSPYTFSFNGSPQQTSDTGKGLCANTYTYVVTDSNTCQFIDTTTITQPTAIKDLPAITKATCYGDCNGSITLSPSGGTPPYNYLWSSGITSTTNSASGLCPGTYTITVTDADNCSLIEMDTVKPSIVIFADITTKNPLCNGSCTGTAASVPSGGTQPYTFSWSTGTTTTGATASTISALCAGSYSLTIIDQNGCTSDTTTNVTQPTAISVTFKVTAITCSGDNDGKIVAIVSGGTPGYTYEWNTNPTLSTDSIINLHFGKDSIQITDSNGCTFDSSTTLANPIPLVKINSTTNASCNNTADGIIAVTVTGGSTPYSYSWSSGGSSLGVTTSTINSLLPGTYVLSLTDSVNCGFTDTVKVSADITVLAKVGNDTSVCAKSPAILNGSGSLSATQYEWFALPRTLVGTAAIITVTPTANTTYMLVVSDGSCRDSVTENVTVNPLPVINVGTVQSIFTTSSATLGGSPTSSAGSTYLWEPSAGIKDSTLSNPVVTPTVTTIYTVTVTSPFGCISIDTVSIFVVPQFIPPDGFTPNGDGINDVWALTELTNFPDASVEVFNRWGERLFYSIGYKTPWDGTFNHEPVPVGTYYYVIKLNDPRFPNAYTGPLTIMR